MELKPKTTVKHERPTAEIIPFPGTEKSLQKQDVIVITEEIEVFLCVECGHNLFYVTVDKSTHCASCLAELQN